MKQAGGVKRTVTKTRVSKNRIETPLAEETVTESNYTKKVQDMAYHLYLTRGCVDGYDVEDWLAAEEIVKAS